jgi:hypothetical protein
MTERCLLNFPSGSGRSAAYCNPLIIQGGVSGSHSPAENGGGRGLITFISHRSNSRQIFSKWMSNCHLRMRRNFNRENRETLSATDDGQQPSSERSANAHGVNADVHAERESDGSVEPAKSANNEEHCFSAVSRRPDWGTPLLCSRAEGEAEQKYC